MLIVNNKLNCTTETQYINIPVFAKVFDKLIARTKHISLFPSFVQFFKFNFPLMICVIYKIYYEKFSVKFCFRFWVSTLITIFQTQLYFSNEMITSDLVYVSRFPITTLPNELGHSINLILNATYKVLIEKTNTATVTEIFANKNLFSIHNLNGNSHWLSKLTVSFKDTKK